MTVSIVMFLIVSVALAAFKPGALAPAGHWVAQGAFFPQGLPALVFALWALHWLGRAGGPLPSPPGLLRFLPFFIAESTRGGLDVARRILAPALRVNPGLACYRTRLRGSGARLLFTNCVNLLPGTLAADLQRDRLRLHLLDAGVDPEPELRRLEQAVARVFHETLPPR